MKKQFTCLFLLVVIAQVCTMENPGIGIGIRKHLVDFLLDNFLQMIEILIVPIPIKSVEFDVKIEGVKLGTISVFDIWINSILIDPKDVYLQNHSVYIQQVEVDFKNNLISFSSDKMRANITAKMDFDDAITHTKANISTNITDIQMDAAVGITMDGDFLNVTIASIDIVIDDFDIKIEGDIIQQLINWIVNVGKPLIKPLLNQLLAKNIKSLVQKAVNNATKKIPWQKQIPIKNINLGVDYEIMGNPQISDEMLTAKANGTFFDDKAAYHPEKQPITLPPFNETGEDLQVYITEHTLNSALMALFENDLFKYTLHNKTLPGKKIPIPLSLDIDFLGIFFPELPHIYGKRLVAVKFFSYDGPPVLVFDDGQLDVRAQGQPFLLRHLNIQIVGIEIFAVMNKNETDLDPFITLVTEAQIGIKVWLTQNETGTWLHENITNFTISPLVPYNTTLTNLRLKGLHATLNLIVDILHTYLPLLKKAFKIPKILSIGYKNPSILWHDHYMSIELTPELGHAEEILPPHQELNNLTEDIARNSNETLQGIPDFIRDDQLEDGTYMEKFYYQMMQEKEKRRTKFDL